jgi:hypothetical protein
MIETLVKNDRIPNKITKFEINFLQYCCNTICNANSAILFQQQELERS